MGGDWGAEYSDKIDSLSTFGLNTASVNKASLLAEALVLVGVVLWLLLVVVVPLFRVTGVLVMVGVVKVVLGGGTGSKLIKLGAFEAVGCG